MLNTAPALRRELQQNLAASFSNEELAALCFDLGIDFDELAGATKTAKVIALLEYLERRDRIPELIARLAQLRPQVAWHELSPGVAAQPEAEPPFKGLAYYDVADHDLFFGREHLTAHLVNCLRECPFLAVVGASGSGKSSLLRAGVVSALLQGAPLVDGSRALQGITPQHTHVIVPSAHPVEALAISLTRDHGSAGDTAALIDDLMRDERIMHLHLRRVTSESPATRSLIVVDQFEELFTLCHSDAERKAFVGNLLHAWSPQLLDGATHPNVEVPYYVVLALRADFYAQCGQFDALRTLLASRQAYIASMSADELRRAVETPAVSKGYAFEPGLVDTILQNVGDEPGALPLLSHALLKTWEKRRGDMLTLEGYVASGGVSGAIAQTADQVFDGLPPAKQAIAKRILVRLVDIRDSAPYTRRRVQMDELTGRPEDAPAAREVLDELAKKRLVTAAQDTYEVAHEALIHEWPRLRRWLDDDRVALRAQQQLNEDARRWEEGHRDASYLYSGQRLAAMQAQLAGRAMELNQLESEFLEASVRAEAERASQEERRRQRELGLERRARRILTALAAVLLGLLLFTTALLLRPLALREMARGPMVAVAGRLVTGLTLRSSLQISEIVGPFAVEQYEVSNRRYQLCVEASACSPPVDRRPFNDPMKADDPVRSVTFEQADTFCQWIGRKLPSAAQWLAAAGITPDRPWPWGTATPAEVEANVGGVLTGPLPVTATGGLSDQGVYNLIGNVWEWTTATVPGDDEYLTAFGGSWESEGTSALETFESLRTFADPTVGLRCVEERQ